MPLRLTALAAALILAGSVHAADRIKVGFVSTLSGPGAGLGVDIRDGFNLAIKQLDGKLGGLPAEVIVADDQQSPDVAKQAVDKFLKKDKVDFMTGIVFSNIMLAVGPTVFENQTTSNSILEPIRQNKLNLVTTRMESICRLAYKVYRKKNRIASQRL